MVYHSSLDINEIYSCCVDISATYLLYDSVASSVNDASQLQIICFARSIIHDLVIESYFFKIDVM